MKPPAASADATRPTRAAAAATPPQAALEAWFAARGWQPAVFQQQVWRHYLAGRSGLLHTPTGSGKTLAALGGPLLEALQQRAALGEAGAARHQPCLKLLWVTPLRALAADTLRAIGQAIDGVGLPWQVGLRTGDASARAKRLARQGRLDVLVTTPESLALLLSYADSSASLQTLRGIVVDEWHELLGSKRGVLLELCLARLRALSPAVRTWGLSATLAELEQARAVLLPQTPDAPLVAGAPPRPVALTTLLPDAHERFPWAGHLGLAQLPRVLQRLMAAPVSLLFANTRAQAELWHRALASVWPEDLATLALHHGSLDPALRAQTEQGLCEGRLRCVVATSSLDLGVDFPAVDQVLQLGSPKGVARLLQRAGRARHRPGETGELIGVPTHGLEILEYAAARHALRRGTVEARRPLQLCLDVLAQHCVTLALGGGFQADALYAEVRRTHAFAALTPADWQAVLDFIAQGGAALQNYPDYHRVQRDSHGWWRVTERRVALRHRLSIGTIAGDGMVAVKFLRGGGIGAVEEGFISRLRPGERFQLAGRLLELVRLEDMTAYVRTARADDGAVPQWSGTRLPLSDILSRGLQAQFAQDPAAPGASPELAAAAPLLALQQRASALPQPGVLLAEWLQLRGTCYLALYPFAGQQVHEGVATLLAWRWAQRQPGSFGFSVADHGLLLSVPAPRALDESLLRTLLDPAGLLQDLQAGFNLAELARRQFREIARIAGLLPPTLPGAARRSMRQLQVSSGLLYDVFKRYDPGHMLLAQAEREVLQQQLDLPRLQATLVQCAQHRLLLCHPNGLTPLALPLWAQSVRGRLSNEDWRTRVQRAAAQLERRHGR